MKRIFFPLAIFLLVACIANSQAVLYNGAANITVDAGAIIYVDGDVVNDPSGLIHNQGDIYLTGDWTNNEASGCLDPATGTVILDGGAQTIMGAQTTTFNNLDCQNGNTKTLNIATIVGGSTGVLSLNSSAFNLNSKTLIVTNPLPSAITRTTGYIISETAPAAGYGTVQWNLGNSTGNYAYPFGTTGGTYIPFICNITTAGVQSTAGNMAVATYPTNVTVNPNNLPYPTSVSNLNDASGNDASLICLDRFWITTPNNYTTAPVADASFYYATPEWDNSAGSTNTIVEDSLRAWRWNGTQWLNPSAGTDNPASNNVAVQSVNTFSIWTLKGAPPCAVAAAVTATTTTITLGNNTIVQLTASGGGTYLWNTIPVQTTASISVSPTSTTVYCVTVTDTGAGCADTACVSIKVEIPCGDFFLPNAFSPNGDTKNDIFKPRNACIKEMDFKIFNRWGNLVFETTDVTKGWDGSTPEGLDGNSEVYAYALKATLNDGTVIDRKGMVHLMK